MRLFLGIILSILSDGWTRIRVRHLDNPNFRNDDADQRRTAADGKLGCCQCELAGMVPKRT